MSEPTPEPAGLARVGGEDLEGFVRQRIQGFSQELLDEEVTALLGRRRYQRRTGVDAAPGYRNGHGRPRRLARRSGTVRRRRPRGRRLEARFESRRLPLFKRRPREVAELLPQLYVQGLAEGAVELARRGLRGAGAPLAASSIARLKAGWQLADAAFKRRPRHDLEVGDRWGDGGDVKAGLERDQAALLVAIGARRDGRQVGLTVEPGERESTDTWAALRRDRKARGRACPRVVVGDGHRGIWGGLAQVYPEAAEQRGWPPRILNVLAKRPKRRPAEAQRLLTPSPTPPADRRPRGCNVPSSAGAGTGT